MLTYTQQKEIQDGDINPPDMGLLTLMGLSIGKYMASFRNMKVIPLWDESDPSKAINANANQYRSQMLRLISNISNADASEFEKITKKVKRAFIEIAGISINIEQINNANQETWESFIDSKMEEILERLAQTTKEGKVEYIGLPQ